MDSRVWLRSAWILGSVLACAAWVGECPGAEVVVLDTRSVWRFHETWRTDVARLASGELVRVNPYKPRADAAYKDENLEAGRYKLRRAEVVRGSAFPPDDWREVAFDDGTWLRRPGPFLGFTYRALALLCVRGKFTVTDPAKADDLSLSVVFQGGLVVHLNGKELARSHLGQGKIEPTTLAEDYPFETFASPDGKLIAQQWYRGGGGVQSYRTPKDLYAVWVAGYKKRSRTLEVKIAAAELREGLNVLALEVHRAPGIELMFTTVPRAGSHDTRIRQSLWWNRASVESVRLTAPAADPAGGVVPNVRRPKGLQVWNHAVFRRVDPNEYADPHDSLRPVRLAGARNGVYAGQVVVSSTEPVGEVSATVSPLKDPRGRVIDAAAVRIRYPRYEKWGARTFVYDALDPAPRPDEKPPGNTQPVWVSVHVPKDADAGDYAGTLTVRVDKREAARVPLRLKVVDWTLPDPQQFTTHVGLVQSAESVALQYGVPMWSERHWELLERSFAVMSLVGARTLYIPVKTRTHFGNEHTMVRWVREADGSHKLDFRLVERYLDLAVKHLGKIPVVCLYIYDGGPSNTRPEKVGTFFTEVDPATGKLSEAEAPGWGTAESQAFWRPVFDGVRRLLAARGMERSLMVGAAQSVRYQAVEDLKAVAPDVPWVAHSHLFNTEFGKRWQTEGQPVAYLAQVGGIFAVFWDPEDGRPFYGWRNPRRVVTYPRDNVGTMVRMTSELTVHRLCAEGSVLSGRRARYPARWGARVESAALRVNEDFPGIRGFGRLGADFWPVLKDKRGSYPICGRYPGTDWGTLNIKHVNAWLLGRGPDGAVSTVRLEMMRESLQEAEARIFVQNALLDDATRAKLGKPLAERCHELMNERTRRLRYVSEFYDDGNGKLLLTPEWNAFSEKLYDTAAEVAEKL